MLPVSQCHVQHKLQQCTTFKNADNTSNHYTTLHINGLHSKTFCNTAHHFTTLHNTTHYSTILNIIAQGGEVKYDKTVFRSLKKMFHILHNSSKYLGLFGLSFFRNLNYFSKLSLNGPLGQFSLLVATSICCLFDVCPPGVTFLERDGDF